MARFNSRKNGNFSSSFWASLLSALFLTVMLIGGFAVYNHYNEKTDEITENVEAEKPSDEVEAETEVETPSEEVVENEAE